MSPLSRPERIEAKRRIAEALDARSDEDRDLILSEFGARTGWSFDDERTVKQYVIDSLYNLDDDVIAALLNYLSPDVGREPSSAGPWSGPSSNLRLFLSHLNQERALAGAVSAALAPFGVECFVAHVDIHPTKEWMVTIEAALRSCDAVAAFLHDGFAESLWCDQEVGIAYGLRIPLVPIKIQGNDPHGFLGKYQAFPADGRPPAAIARGLLGCLDAAPTIGTERVTDALIGALGTVTSYPDAIAVTEELASRSVDWKPERLELLRAAMDNDQVSGSVVAGPRVAEWLRVHAPPPAPPSDDDVPF